MRRIGIAVLIAYLLLAIAHVSMPAPPVVDLGKWRLLVLQSDDWGFEGWFPDEETAGVLNDLTAPLPGGLNAYKSSGLESAQDIDALAALLASRRDLDGLPAVLQANVIVSAIDVLSCGAAPLLDPLTDLELRRPGECGPYRREGRRAAEDRAIAAGVWYPELHGLTHYNLEGMGDAVREGAEMTRRAAAYGVVAFPHYAQRTELEGTDAARAEWIANTAVELFHRRYGRSPGSVIAPDYTWGAEDERAWIENGIGVVQAKRNQIDPTVDPTNPWGRAKKVFYRWLDRLRRPLVYLDRNAVLEPYGADDPGVAQGAQEAMARIQAAWARGEAACLETHRVQYSNFDPRVVAAGRAQLERLLKGLEAGPGVRYCLDVELAQLMRRGWSQIERGPWLIVRNYTGGPIRLELPRFRGRSLAPGTHVLPQRQNEDHPAQD